MTLRNQPTTSLALALLVTAFSANAAFGLPLIGKKKTEEVLPSRKLTASQSQLIDKAIVREKEVIKTIKERTPLVETYIQNMRPDNVLGQVPDEDEHFLARVDFGKIIGSNIYEVNKATSEGTSGKGGFFKS